jgi:NADP-dependent 3-hydroxy acid dehydrogenase YdfG
MAESGAGRGGIGSRRLVVVGASAGIGRAFAIAAAKAGADVVVASRRRAVLDEVVAEAGSGIAVEVDVGDPASRAALASLLAGGPPVDLVLVTVGVADLRPLAETDDAGWTAILRTNVVGVAGLIADLRGVLAPHAVVAVLSSETARHPRYGLVPYAASKAALGTLLAGCRIEHPGLRVSCVVVGATVPTEFGARFTGEQLRPAFAAWQAHGQMQQEYMATEDVAQVLLDLYATALRHPGVNVDEVVLRSPSGLLGT